MSPVDKENRQTGLNDRVGQRDIKTLGISRRAWRVEENSLWRREEDICCLFGRTHLENKLAVQEICVVANGRGDDLWGLNGGASMHLSGGLWGWCLVLLVGGFLETNDLAMQRLDEAQDIFDVELEFGVVFDVAFLVDGPGLLKLGAGGLAGSSWVWLSSRPVSSWPVIRGFALVCWFRRGGRLVERGLVKDIVVIVIDCVTRLFGDGLVDKVVVLLEEVVLFE